MACDASFMKSFFAWLGIITGLIGFVLNIIWPEPAFLWPLISALWAFCFLSERKLGALTSHQAFVQGAKWWEYQQAGATMWQSDQKEAHEQAKWLAEQDKLGRIS